MSAAPRALHGASVLITGASGGLGRALTQVCAARGATLTLIGRDAARLDAAAGGAPGSRTAILDLRLPEACDRAVATAIDHAGRLDVVINAVGVVAFGPIDQLSPDTMEELFLTNVFVPIMLARAAIGGLAEGGVVVNVSGVIAEQNLPGMAAYGASKAATRSFDDAFAREARRRGVRVLDARPPHTDTGLATRAIAGTPPRFGPGLDPAHVARIIVDGIERGATDLPSTAFGPDVPSTPATAAGPV